MVDAQLARLVKAVDDLDLEARVHWVVVSDHGMSALGADRVIVLDDYIDPSALQIVDIGRVAHVQPRRALSDDAALQPDRGQASASARVPFSDLPARYGLAGHPRLAADRRPGRRRAGR